MAIVSEQSPTDAATVLWKALQEGLILPTSQVYKFFQGIEQSETQSPVNLTYRFLHDRVQQAAYSLIPEAQKQLAHWQIGQLLQQGLSEQEQVEQIFDIVNQLNLGRATISNPVQKQQLAQMNLQAGQKAKLSSAYQAAQNYYEIGISLLTTDAWQTDYPLAYALHRDASEAAYLCGNFEQAEVLYEVTLAQADTSLDKAAVYRVQMTQYQLQGRNTEAIAIQRQSLHLLGWTMPIEPEDIQASLDEQIAAVNRFLETQTIASILEFPQMEDHNIAEILRILQILFYAAWLDGQPTLALLALAAMTTLSLQHGNSEMSPFGYVGYGLIANAVLKNAPQAHQFGDMAVQLCEQFDNADVRGMTNFLFAADVHSWSRPLRAADPYYENALKYGMDAGNWLTVGFTMMLSGSDRLTYGKNLDDLYAIAQTHAEFLRQIKSLENLDALVVGVLQPIRHLLNLTTNHLSFDDEDFSETAYLQKYHSAPYHLAWFYSVKIRHAYLFGQQATYSALIPQLNLIETTISSHAKVPSSVFYVALMHLALIESTQDQAERQSHWQAILPLEEQLTRWEQDCPENIRHKSLLLRAEKARLHGQKSEAIECYEQAITQAQDQGYGYEAALANELAAKFYLSWGKEKIAQEYLTNAYYGYARWGAKAKVQDLEQRYPQLLAPILQQQRMSLSAIETAFTITSQYPSTQSSNSGNTSISDTLDLATILKTSQTLSSEIQLDKLLATLLHTVLENAGADKGVLLMPRENQWFVEAVATVDQPAQIQSIALSSSSEVPQSLINTVKHSREAVVIVDASAHPTLAMDAYVMAHQPKSLLCTAILNQGKLVAILYLENHVTVGAFTRDRVELLNLLCVQAAISLENARTFYEMQQTEIQLQKSHAFLNAQSESSLDGILVVYRNREIHSYNQRFLDVWKISPELRTSRDDQKMLAHVVDKMANPQAFLEKILYLYDHIDESSHCELLLKDGRTIERTSVPVNSTNGENWGRIWYFRDITNRKQAEETILQKSQDLELALSELQNTQLQMVQSEKMASLGNLVAGVAHEINNPIGFLNGSINNGKDYVQDLLGHLALYQQHYPNPVALIQDHAEEIDLEFLSADLPKLLNSMKGATNRITGISTSLRTFSRADAEYKVSANIHDGIDSTILILKYRLKANEHRPAINVIQDYGDIPAIDCFPGQLNQVFMNILANAIDMFDEKAQGQSFEQLEAHPQQITIRTTADANQVQIQIADNGKGMTEDVRARIFDHLFTTKAVGKGTGLGLAIARQIIEEKHGGKISCHSTPGIGTEFAITIPLYHDSESIR
ncbi:ATP-binding protein [Leptothoe sp. PORK10 BA2]|uniref:ATP-binding protein n=1 Tax=Leptothoe sp. PORK10 BA2 TaxID=3110254 RepID=UPI002B210DAB|nr:ATP-binding protein [Leptothoe sp. PORK10 BA2]MEA5467139.1 ATP-binding protein [Leptothoe sp. PORK10 BA2]